MRRNNNGSSFVKLVVAFVAFVLRPVDQDKRAKLALFAILSLLLIASSFYYAVRFMWALVTPKTVCFLFTAAVGYIIFRFFSNWSAARRRRHAHGQPQNSSIRDNLLNQICGNVFDEFKTRVNWGWDGLPVVGDSVYFDVLLFKTNGRPHNIKGDATQSAAVYRNHNSSSSRPSVVSSATNETSTTSDEDEAALAVALIESAAAAEANLKVQVLIEIADTCEQVPSVEELCPNDVKNAVRFSFTTRKSGMYKISVIVNSHKMSFQHGFVPDRVDAGNVRRKDDCSLVVCELGEDLSFEVELRDRFGNICSNYEAVPIHMDVDFSVSVHQADVFPAESFTPVFYVSTASKSGHCVLNIILGAIGCYNITIHFRHQLIKNGHFGAIFLSEGEKKSVTKLLESRKITYHKAQILPAALLTYDWVEDDCGGDTAAVDRRGGSDCDRSSSASVSVGVGVTSAATAGGMGDVMKTQDVYCYFSSKHLIVAKYHLRIFQQVLASFRISPSTKLEFTRPPIVEKALETGASNNNVAAAALLSGGGGSKPLSCKPFLQIDDGVQLPVQMFCDERSVIAAAFVSRMLKNIGGSECFVEKRKFLRDRLSGQCCTADMLRRTFAFCVKRASLLESSLAALGSKKDLWTKLFVVSFAGEEGQDCGGLRREWLNLVCAELFSPNGAAGLFRRLTPEDPNSPLHPVSGVPKSSLKYMEFAGKILAKSLLESSISSSSQASLPFRLSKSFLAQIIGLRVNLSHLEVDDPELYKQKVRYILDNDVTDLEMTFTEEDYDPHRTPSTKIHELIPSGAKTAVTNANKKFYLDQLVQFKLVSSSKTEVDEFRKGFEAVISSELLMMFSENELELLLCGASTISVVDLKMNCQVSVSPKMMSWFWTLVDSLTQEELSLLLQFITGSCRLPVGGFKELEPVIQISPVYSLDILPTAHTCFNRLNLPNYSSYQSMHRQVLLALNEGSSGFGLS